jgi:DNA-binding GntR family transcriptional regulator
MGRSYSAMRDNAERTTGSNPNLSTLSSWSTVWTGMSTASSDAPTQKIARARKGGSRDNIAAIHDELREAILRGDLRAGAVLSQLRLAEDFGVSRGPVREALRLLQREGLVEAELNRRVRIADFSVDDLEELYAMRIVNEALAVRATVPRLTAQQLQELHKALEEMDAAAGVDVRAWEEPHRRFHRGLVTHAGQRLVTFVEQLSDHAERYRRVYIAGDPRAWSVGAADHREIYEAAERRDADGASDAAVQHLARTALTVLANLAPTHDPSLVRGAMRANLAPDQPARPMPRPTTN